MGNQRFAMCWPVLVCFFGLLMSRASCVIVSNITLMTESNRTDYTLQGEAASLHCNYMPAPDEIVSMVRWEWKRRGSEESTEVYVWRPGRRPAARESFFGRTDLSNTEPSIVVIRQTHMEMEGKYRCLVQTNQMQGYTDFTLIVIVDACHENVWRTNLNIDTCTETIDMNCVGLFPKPSPSCGVFNEDTRSFLTSVPFDRVVTLHNHTYEVSLKNKYSIRDWYSYTNITFRCFFVIDGTSWRRGIVYRLFGAYGCSPTPPLPGAGTYNMSEEKSCWRKPREGATVHYSCNGSMTLKGPETLVCRNGLWQPESLHWTGPSKPTCNGSQVNPQSQLFVVIVVALGSMLWMILCF